MNTATFTFHAELNDFLPPERRGAQIAYTVRGRASVKDAIESLGVPHPEVEAIVVGGVPVDFSYIVREGDSIDVFPISVLIAHVPLRPPLPAQPRFVLDTHLGQLANYLRMLGFDTLYRNDYADDELAQVASDEQRILLTRDRGLLKRGIVTYGYYVRETSPRRQIVEIVRRYALAGQAAPLRRCIRCNGPLRAVRKEDVLDRLPPKTRVHYQEFSACASCGHIYWKGSHYDRMRQFIEQALGDEMNGGS